MNIARDRNASDQTGSMTAEMTALCTARIYTGLVPTPPSSTHMVSHMALVAVHLAARLRPIGLWRRAAAVSRYCDHVSNYPAGNLCRRLSTEAAAGNMCVRLDDRDCSLYLNVNSVTQEREFLHW